LPLQRPLARELDPRIASRRQRAASLLLQSRLHLRHEPDLSGRLEMPASGRGLSLRDVLLPALPCVPRLADCLPAIARRLSPRSIRSHVIDAGSRVTSCSDRRRG
jgi:hypothetical protein